MSTAHDILETETMGRVMLRIVPLLIVCYIASYLDRVNVGLAALTMNRDLGFSAAAYGLGAGVFFLTYFIFEVPSNLMLHRFGASLKVQGNARYGEPHRGRKDDYQVYFLVPCLNEERHIGDGLLLAVWAVRPAFVFDNPLA